MRKLLAVGLTVVAVLAMLAPPAFAQAAAPKVTISGLLQFVVASSENVVDANLTRDNDTAFYSRQRGRFDIIGAVGKTKGVWGIELDFSEGFGGATTGGPASSPGQSAGFDLDTDVPGFTETKWLYLEIPFTGAGSLIPAIPFEGSLRAGAQPATAHSYKGGALWSGDFPGVNVTTKWAPNVRSTITYAQIEESVDISAADESYAWLMSVEVDIFKGLSIKPTYTYARYEGGNDGGVSLGTLAKDGFTPAALAPGTKNATTRHTFGVEARWSTGPFSLEPSLWIQRGTQECRTTVAAAAAAGCPTLSAGAGEVDIESWLADVIAGVRLGPLNLRFRGAWTPGMKAGDSVNAGDDIKYYEAVNPGFVYMAGAWSEMETSNIEYSSVVSRTTGSRLGLSPSYDKYGRIFAGARADYDITPAFTVYAFGNLQWTDEKVDTDKTITFTGGDGRGDSRYLGAEVATGFFWRFAPNVQFQPIAAYMFAGKARDHIRPGTGAATPTKDSAEDAYKLAVRLHYTF